MVKRYTLDEAKQLEELTDEILKVHEFIQENKATEIAQKLVSIGGIIAPVCIKTIAEQIVKDHKEYMANLEDELDNLGREYKS